jgi:hypothetical protein
VLDEVRHGELERLSTEATTSRFTQQADTKFSTPIHRIEVDNLQEADAVVGIAQRDDVEDPIAVCRPRMQPVTHLDRIVTTRARKQLRLCGDVVAQGGKRRQICL